MRLKSLLLLFGFTAGLLSVLAIRKRGIFKRAGAAVCETVCDLAKCTRFSCCK